MESWARAMCDRTGVQQPAWETCFISWQEESANACPRFYILLISTGLIIIGSIRHLLASMDVAKATGGLIDVWLPPESSLSGSS